MVNKHYPVHLLSIAASYFTFICDCQWCNKPWTSVKNCLHMYCIFLTVDCNLEKETGCDVYISMWQKPNTNLCHRAAAWLENWSHSWSGQRLNMVCRTFWKLNASTHLILWYISLEQLYWYMYYPSTSSCIEGYFSAYVPSILIHNNQLVQVLQWAAPGSPLNYWSPPFKNSVV